MSLTPKSEKLPLSDLYPFFCAISKYYHADIPIDIAIDTYLHSSNNENMKLIIADVLNNMKNGKTFSEALNETGKFPQFIVENLKECKNEPPVPPDPFKEVVEYLQHEINLKREIANSSLTGKKETEVTL